MVFVILEIGSCEFPDEFTKWFLASFCLLLSCNIDVFEEIFVAKSCRASIEDNCEDFFKLIFFPSFSIFKSNSKLQSQVVHIGVNEQNTLKQTEQTKWLKLETYWKELQILNKNAFNILKCFMEKQIAKFDGTENILSLSS